MSEFVEEYGEAGSKPFGVAFRPDQDVRGLKQYRLAFCDGWREYFLIRLDCARNDTDQKKPTCFRGWAFAFRVAPFVSPECR